MNEIFFLEKKPSKLWKQKKGEEYIIKMYCLHDKAYTTVKSVWIVKGRGKTMTQRPWIISRVCESTYNRTDNELPMRALEYAFI